LPKPYILRRPSGLYVRLLVPHHLRPILGHRYIVRSLGSLRGDEARLAAAAMGYAFAQACQGDGSMIDIKDILKRGRLGFELQSGPDGSFSLKTDGSAQDNAAGLEALRAWKGEEASSSPPATQKPAVDKSPTLGQSVRLFMDQFVERSVAPATVRETRSTLELFAALTGPKVKLSALNVTHVDAFRSALSVWPARAGVMPEYRDLSAPEILRKVKRSPAETIISPRTKDKHLDSVRKFFAWCCQRGQMQRNFLAGIRIQTKAQRAQITRRGFTTQELQTLFDPSLQAAHAASTPSYYWLPFLALYTGARLRELAQLRLVDVREIEGVWGVDINLNAGPLKNVASQRFVPLAASVMDAGFLTYLEDVRHAGLERIFPDGSWSAKNGPGDRTSKWFNRTMTKAAGLDDADLVFHSFRHTFASAADAVGLTEAQIGALTGHTATSVLGKHYIHAQALPERKNQIDEIAVRLLVPSPNYQSGQFAEVLKVAVRQHKHKAAMERRKARAKRR
jgi:integrase